MSLVNCLLSICIVSFGFINLAADLSPTSASASAPIPGRSAPPVSSLNSIPLFFIANNDQLDSPVQFYFDGGQESIYFTPQGLIIRVDSDDPKRTRDSDWVLRLDYVDANKHLRFHGEELSRTVVRYFSKASPGNQNGIPTFHRVVCDDVWPGIDAIYEVEGDRLKTTFRVEPGADPRRIKLAWRGASDVRIAAAGEMFITTPVRDVIDDRPVSYQHNGNQKVEIATAYLRDRSEKQGLDRSFIYGFEVDSYDRSKTLEIAPAIKVSICLLGGQNHDYGKGVAVDSANNIYITGTSHSSVGFPSRVGPAPVNYGGDGDVFVAKLSPKGELLYCGFIGGPGKDGGRAISVDHLGAVYIVGYTQSAEFPVTFGAFDASFGQSLDGFVAKLDPGGLNLVYCTFLGGGRSDEATDLAIDKAGNAYVTGTTDSRDFPSTGTPAKQEGDRNVFVAKIDSIGSRLVWGVILGGNSADEGEGIAIDGSGNAYVTGTTESADFPGTNVKSEVQSVYRGDGDVFVIKISPAGDKIIYSRFLGGKRHDAAAAIAVDDTGSACITGTTCSVDFPIVSPGTLSIHKGGSDVILAKLDQTGNLDFSIYVGGVQNDIAGDLTIDRSGNAYLTGQTHSHDFPIVDAMQSVYAGGSGDAFVTMIDPVGRRIVFSTYLGGRGDDIGEDIVLTDSLNLYVVGSTCSSNFPNDLGYTIWAPSYPDNTDAFIARINTSPIINMPPSRRL